MSSNTKRAKRASLTVQTLPLADLRPHPRNPRVHPAPGDPQWAVLKASLAHDYFDPIVWNQRNGMLVSGHLRTKVLLESGFTSADCVVVDYDEATHVARMLAANKLQGQDDMAAIKDLLQDIDTGEFDMALSGYDEKDIENLMTQFHNSENAPSKKIAEQYVVMITCRDEMQQTELLDRFLQEGLECKALQS